MGSNSVFFVWGFHVAFLFVILGTKLEAKRKVIRERRQLFKINFSDMPSEVIFIKVHVYGRFAFICTSTCVYVCVCTLTVCSIIGNLYAKIVSHSFVVIFCP